MAETASENLSTTLVKAIKQDKFSLVKLLLEQGANPNFVLPTSGVSPFHLAIGASNLNALAYVQLMLQHNGNPNIRSFEGMTPVHVAALWGRYQALQLLLLSGGDPALLDEDGANAMDMAKEHENWDCVGLIATLQTEERQHEQNIERHLEPHSYDKNLCSSSEQNQTCNFSTDCTPNLNCASSDSPDLLACSPHSASHINQCEQLVITNCSTCKSQFPNVQHVSYSQSVQEENKTESYNKEDCERTLSSKDLEEALLSSGCHGLDLTSPDHPVVFTKLRRSFNCDTSPLDKTVLCVAHRRSIGLRREFPADCCGRSTEDETKHFEILKSSPEENSVYACADTISSIKHGEQLSTCTCMSKGQKTQAIISGNDQDESLNEVLIKLSEFQYETPNTRHMLNSDGDKTHNKSSEQTRSQASMSAKKEPTKKSNDVGVICSDLQASDKYMYDNCPTKNGTIGNGVHVNEENKKMQPYTERSMYSSTCSYLNFTEAHYPIHNRKLQDCMEHDSDKELDSVEYLYHDQDNGAVFIEKRCSSASCKCSHYNTCLSITDDDISSSDETILYDWKAYQTDDCYASMIPTSATLPKELIHLTDEGIRELMQTFGETAGPITASTRMVYLQHLAKLQSDPEFTARAARRQPTHQGFIWELAKYLSSGKLEESDHNMGTREQQMVAIFQTANPSHKWREGTLKSSFNYLLLDPRVTKDLPGRFTQLTQIETFQIFVAAAFYIGKGKRGRPYAHFYEALHILNESRKFNGQKQLQKHKKEPSAKVRHILDIWAAGLGVVSLHCFQSVIPVEAYTREACMVDAMGIARLTNMKIGDFYGPSRGWSSRQRRQMGVFLLKKACQIFLVEGERQIRPADIALGQ